MLFIGIKKKKKTFLIWTVFNNNYFFKYLHLEHKKVQVLQKLICFLDLKKIIVNQIKYFLIGYKLPSFNYFEAPSVG